ncbi:MAG: hypothetical protein R2762_20520 [Bryobacteraceae bacterium]
MRTVILLMTASCIWAGEVRITPTAAPKVNSPQRALAEETQSVSAPVAGYAVTQSPLSVRGLLGAPGAIHYADAPFTLPEGVRDVRIAPGHGWLLAVRGENEAASAWIPEQGLERELGVVRGADWSVEFSGGGESALFLVPSTGRAYVFTGLPNEPEMAADLSAADWPADIAGLAISRDGKLLTACTRQGGVWLLAANGQPAHRLLADGLPAASIAFDRGSGRLLILDRTAGRVLTVEAPEQGTGALVLLPETGSAWSAAARLLSVPDGVLVADSETGRVAKIVLETQSVEFSEAGAFSEARPLRWQGSLLLSGLEGAASRIFAPQPGAESAVSYVPISRTLEVTGEGEQQ